MSKFLLPMPNSYPFVITARPDGAVSFTESDNNAGKIDRIPNFSSGIEFIPRNGGFVGDFYRKRFEVTCIYIRLEFFSVVRATRTTMLEAWP